MYCCDKKQKQNKTTEVENKTHGPENFPLTFLWFRSFGLVSTMLQFLIYKKADFNVKAESSVSIGI